MDFIRESRRARELNLTPLVDIVLLLVIFFMLSTSFVVSESMELTLPSGKAKGAVSGDVMRLLITPQGQVQLNNGMLDLNALSGALAERLGDHPDTKIAIFTTPGVSVQQLVAVLDEVYLTGGRNVQVDKIDG
jgi:biopolymer transport protein ExbD